MNQIDLFIFDLDGTIYRGDEIIPHAKELLATLRSYGKKIRFLTNNATQTPSFFVEKINRMGIECVLSEVMTSALGTALYCSQNGIKKVGVFGEDGLISTLESKGIETIHPELDWNQKLDAVVAGLFRTANYNHVTKAMSALRTGVKFIATNLDATFPLENGHFIPGAGAMIAAISTASGTTPTVIGKPNALLTTLSITSAGVSPNRTLVVGDRMNTDIESGIEAGAHTFLVLTGVEKIAPLGQPFGEDLRALNRFL